MIDIPQFNSKKELFSWLVANKQTLIAQKKFEIKFADPFVYNNRIGNNEQRDKAVVNNDTKELLVKSIINTTNWLDSHGDVHIPGLWAKSISETKGLYLLQEHKMSFDKIISDEVTASTQNFTFRELGIDINGITQALVFDSVVQASRNKYMYNQYLNGWVKNHSVGMRYVKIVMCVNDEDYGAEYEAWNKYITMVANMNEAEDRGYFWAVTEAKIIEGSAVPIGSNIVTPTISVNDKAAEQGTFNIAEPPNGTLRQEQKEVINWEKIASIIN